MTPARWLVLLESMVLFGGCLLRFVGLSIHVPTARQGGSRCTTHRRGVCSLVVFCGAICGRESCLRLPEPSCARTLRHFPSLPAPAGKCHSHVSAGWTNHRVVYRVGGAPCWSCSVHGDFPVRDTSERRVANYRGQRR